MKATKWMTLAVVAVLASACGGDDGKGTGPGGGDNGDFSAEVSGDLETTFEGWSYFGLGEDEQGNQGFGVVMSEVESGEANGGVITIVRVNENSLPAGDYEIKDATGELNDGDVVALAIDTDGTNLAALFSSIGGTLHVTSSNGSTIKGTFEFDATGVVFEDPETELGITVEGDFTARTLPDGSVRVSSMKLSRSH